MQLDARKHFREIGATAIGEYVEAETDLSEATAAADDDRIQKTRFSALRLGDAAAINLHHFADIVATRPSKGLPDFESSVAKVREFLQAKSADDLVILGDAADALKHAVLTYRLPRQVEEAGQVLVVSRGYSVGRYGEGKFGGGRAGMDPSALRPAPAYISSSRSQYRLGRRTVQLSANSGLW